MVKIAVLVSGGGTNLQALIDRQQAGELGCGQISLVISSRAGVYAWTGRKSRYESMVISRKECGSAENFDKKLVSELKSHGIELVVLAGFLSILGKEVIDALPNASSTFTISDSFLLRKRFLWTQGT